MEEKKYPIFEEEEGDSKVCEPLAAPVADYCPVGSITANHDRIDDLDWDQFPSFGPFSDEEAIARVAEAEKDLNDPSKWITIEDLDAELKRLHPWL